MSTRSELRLVLRFEAMFPAAENRCSDGVNVVGIHSKVFASFASVGQRAAFIFHHDSGFSVLDRGCSPKYLKTCGIVVTMKEWMLHFHLQRAASFAIVCTMLWTLNTWSAGKNFSFRNLGSRAAASRVMFGDSGVNSCQSLPSCCDLFCHVSME